MSCATCVTCPNPTAVRSARAPALAFVRPTPRPTVPPSWKPMPEAKLAEQIRALAPWFHNLAPDGIPPPPAHFLGAYPRQKFQRFAPSLPADLRGKTVLDIGWNAGF